MSVTSLGTTPDARASGEPLRPVGEGGRLPAAARPVHTDLHVVPDVNPPSVRLSSLLPLGAGLVVALAVAVGSDVSLAPWACATAWAAVSGARAVLPGLDRSPRGLVGAELRTGIGLGFLVCVSGIVGLVSIPGARWGLVAVLAAMTTAVTVRWLRPSRAVSTRVVLVGTEQDIESYTRSGQLPGVTVAGCHVVDAGPALAVPASAAVPITTTMETVDELARSVAADLVLVLPSRDVDADVIRRLTWALERSRVRVGVLTPVSAVSDHRLSTTQLGDCTVLEVGPLGGTALEAGMKSVLDRVAAALVLLVVSPLLLLLLAAVRLDSKGPGLFVQTRVGKDGTLFRMVKLRTMYADAEAMKQALLEDNESDGVLFKIRRDPRVTRVGYWLRRSSLDELPQLLNVLCGQMSMVGPRPALPSEVAAYDRYARRRLAVKPGITGLWQVSGRSDLTWDESVRLDLHYADNWRLADDLSIGARTISAVVRARGAY